MAESAKTPQWLQDIKDEPPLSAEEGRQLWLSMAGMFDGKFEEYGGAAAFYQQFCRETEGEDADETVDT